ncbi:MAG: YihY/virulence factor BrkB family protein [Acidimicrobiia bacterium]
MPQLPRPVRRFADAVGRLPSRVPALRVAVDVQHRYDEVHGGYLAGAISLAAFVSLLPLLLVATALLGVAVGSRPDFAGDVIEAVGLRPGSEAADTIVEALETAESSKSAASVLGLAGLAWSGFGLVSALQYAYASVWEVQGRGIRDRLVGLLWLAGSGALFAALLVSTAAIGQLPAAFAPVQVLVALVVAFGLFLWAARVLPAIDVDWRELVPGSIAGAVGFQVLSLLGTVYVPRIVASSSALYGTIGVFFALLAWLLLLGRVVVYAATLNVVLYERRHGTVEIEVEVPAVPGRVNEPKAGAGEGTAQ